MAYLTSDQLGKLGLRAYGRDVLISDKAAIYDAGSISLGSNVRIDDFCVLSGKVEFGSNCHIAVFCNIAGGTEGVRFEDFSGLAYGCHVFSQSDDYSGHSMAGPIIPDRFKQVTRKPVLLQRHAIVGTGSVILPGVTVAEGCAIGAMSLLNRSTKPWGIYAGRPARRVRNRSQEILKLEAEFLRSQNY